MSNQNDIESSIAPASSTSILFREQTSKDMLEKASAGLALQGMLISANEEEILQQRFNLITVQGNISLTQPSHQGIDKTEEFKSQVKETIFKKGIEKFGSSIKASAEGSSLFQGLLNASASFSLDKERKNNTEEKKTTESLYYSKVQYVVVPTAACTLNPNQIRFDSNALQELKEIDKFLRNPQSEDRAIQDCQNFLQNYGSHALLGTVTFGSIFLVSASKSEFSSTEEQNIKNIVNNTITTHLKIGFTGIGGGSLDTNHSSSTENQYIHKQESDESIIKVEKVQIGGSQPSQWAVIDRDYRKPMAVWEIICRHYLNEFQNSQRLAEMLHDEWMKISGLKTNFRYFVDEIAKIDHKIHSLLNQQIPSWIQQRQLTAENLNHLVTLRKEVEGKTDSNQYWVREILSAKIFQEYLLDVRHNNADSKEIKDLMRLILTPDDTTAMSKEDYSQFKEIFKWLNEKPEIIGFFIPDDINNVDELIKKIRNILQIILQENNSTRENRKKQATQDLSLAINSLRFKLREQDKLSELSLLSLLFSFGYMPDLNIFNQVMEIKDYENLEKLLREDQENPFGIEAKNDNTEKKESYLILKILTSDLLSLEEENTIDFIEQTLLPNLQSESIENILKRYNVGLSYECVEVVKEIQNIIQNKPNNENFGTGWQDIPDGDDKNLPTETPLTLPDEQPGTELQDILERLGLTKYYPRKLGREEVYSITEYSLEQNIPANTEQLATHFLSNLISFNYEGRKLKIALKNQSTNESEQTLPGSRFGRRKKQEAETANVYPLDVITATFLCCNPIIQQDLVERLWGCKLAIPLVIQENEHKSPKFFLWAMRSLVMKWKTLQGEIIKSEERRISNYPLETVSFIRFNKSDFSKSSLLNWVISENEPDKSHPIFFHRNSEGSTKNRNLADGMVEIGWYLPKGVKEDIFQDIVSFTNLRGDARNYPVQLELIKQISAKVVILVSATELREKEAEIVQNFLEFGKNVIILLTDQTITAQGEETVENFLTRFPNYDDKQLVILDIENKNSPDIRDEIRQNLTKIKAPDNYKISLENLAKTMEELGINVDELEENCQQGIRKAAKILQIIKIHDLDKRKAELLPLQGKDWADWAEAEKEIHRLENIGEKTLQQYVERQELRKIESRNQQFTIVKDKLPEMMKLFITALLSKQSSVREYFVRALKLGLDELSREELPHLYSSYGEQMKKIHEAKTPEEKADISQELDKLDLKILSQSFGLEHLLREMGQIYSAVMKKGESERANFKQLEQLPQIAADLILSGYPVEIMDGDVGSVPFIWVEAVLKELNQILRKQEGKENLRVFVLSAMGIQSSGKSTLLNTMFGLQFAVSAGRCTKGVFLQPVKLEQKLREKLNIDYIFVVDTEGLKSPELSSGSTRKHDNELSTFVIGLSNLTLIKLPGENNTYLQEMLPISVHAFLRMKEVNLHPKTKIVHRNVDKSSQEKLNTQSRILNENLDKYTRIACEFERRQIQTFKELIDFNLTEDVEYLPSLYEGDDARNAVIPNYSKEVNELKRKIVQGLISSKKLSITEFCQHLNNLWEAVKKDDFVYEFKSTIETQARGELDKFWSQIDREFRTGVTEFTINSHTRIMNCHNEAELCKVSEESKENLSKEIDQIFLKQEKDLKEFFDETTKDKYEGSMQQWKPATFARLTDLMNKLRNQNNQKIESYQNNRQAELTINKEVQKYEQKITEKIRLFVQEEKKKKSEQGEMLSLTKQELRKLFDHQWELWMLELRSNYRNPLQPANVEKDTEDALRELNTDKSNLIIGKIRTTEKLSNFDYSDFSVRKEYYEWDWIQAGKNTFAQLTKGSIPKEKEQEVIREIEKLKDNLFGDVTKMLRQKEESSDPYNESYVRDILKQINSTIEKKSDNLFNNLAFRLTKELEIDLAFAICGHAIKRLKNIDQKYIENRDPIINLEKSKEYYFEIFKVNFNKENLATATVSVLCEIIRQGISEKIEVSLASEIGNRMFSTTHANILNNKKSLIASILISLAEKDKIESYYTYIKNPERSIKAGISSYFDEFNDKNKGVKGVIENKINQLLDAAENFVISTNQYIESQEKKDRSITNWTNKFSELTREYLIVKNIDERIETLVSNSDDNFDFDYQRLESELSQQLKSTKLQLAGELGDFSNSGKDKYTDLKAKVVEEIITLRIGCLASCPFCGEICIHGEPGHEGDHETPYHRPQGVYGYRPVEGEPKLVTKNCQQNIAGEGKFRNAATNNESKPYKDYREVNDDYASWKIIGDPTLESGSYWKWFMKTYSAQLAERYEAATPDIPETWKESFSKEDEIKKLKELI